MTAVQAQAMYTHLRSRGEFAANIHELILGCARLGVPVPTVTPTKKEA